MMENGRDALVCGGRWWFGVRGTTVALYEFVFTGGCGRLAMDEGMGVTVAEKRTRALCVCVCVSIRTSV